jgi:hypothetical protein
VSYATNGEFFQIDPQDIERIKEYNLDILIQLGSGNLSGDIYRASKYGVWSYVLSDDRSLRGRPPGFWEVVENISETGVVLKITTENRNNSNALYRSLYFTYPFSPARNRNALYWSASTILSRQVEALYRLGEKDFFEEIGKYNQEFDIFTHKFHEFPSNFQALKHFFYVFCKIMAETSRRIFYLPTWYLMFTLNNTSDINVCTFISIFPPKDRYWADPHVINLGDKYYVFIEEYQYKNKKGRISVIEIDSNGSYQDPVCVLEKEYHLSYPFVFERQGNYFMVPESAQNRSIDLYECIEFPKLWKYRISLMKNVRAVDTTLFFNQGYWWLFTALTENEGSVMPSELFLFYSKELITTEWTPHPRNPIVSDIKKARPAGGLFKQNGKIFRPSQYTSKTYGYGFDLNEILVLSKTKYAEQETVNVRPFWDKKVLATHTFSKAGQLTIIDAFTQRMKIN